MHFFKCVTVEIHVNLFKFIGFLVVLFKTHYLIEHKKRSGFLVPDLVLFVVSLGIYKAKQSSLDLSIIFDFDDLIILASRAFRNLFWFTKLIWL